jgi:GMC oxidoreductase
LREEAVFDRVFIAAGALATTRIVLESRGWLGETFELKDSQKFVLPFFRRRRAPISWPRTNALAALFVELQLPDLSQHWSHVQVSAVNDYVLERLGLLGDGRRWLRATANIVLERLMVAWCSLHSDQSSMLALTLLAETRGGEHILRVEHRLRPEAMRAMLRVTRALRRYGPEFGACFIPALLQPSLPGAGMHTGGAFPMRATPRERRDTDAIGRLIGQDRIHLIDASVFPSIPATTIALPLMANAHRIAGSTPL